jgi:hypothetical protein
MAMLKGLVVVLGVLIVVALGVIAVTVANRLSDGGKTETAATDGAHTTFGDIRVALPHGARVVETHAEGGRLVLRVERADGEPQILIYDLATGRALGTVTLTVPGAVAPVGR